MGLLINVVISLATFTQDEPLNFGSWYFITLYITLFLFTLVLVLKIPPVNKRFQRFLENIAIKTSKKNKKTNTINVIDLQGRHAIAELKFNVVP